MKISKIFWISGCVVLALFLLAIGATEAMLHPGRRPLLAESKLQIKQIAAGHKSDFEEVEMSAADGAILRAWNLQPARSNGTVVIVFHGVSDNRASMNGYSEIFLRHGYGVLMPDARAHGASGGEMATYGLRESDDIRRWLDWVETNDHPACIYSFAESMGAAGLLQSLQSETRFCAVVAESPFSSFREIAYDRVGQFFHLGPWMGRTILRPVVMLSFLYARWKYHLDFDQVSPEKAVASTKVPVLLIHGKVDGNIPIRHSRTIAGGNHRVELWEVPGADHCGAIGAAPGEFEKRVVAWFEQNNRINATSSAVAGL